MAPNKYPLLIHQIFWDKLDKCESIFGQSYYDSAIKQLEKAHKDPLNAGERFHGDFGELQDCLRKYDIKGPEGPKLFWILWTEEGLILPFHITTVARKDLKNNYSNVYWSEPAEIIYQALVNLPETSDEFEVGVINDGELACMPASKLYGS